MHHHHTKTRAVPSARRSGFVPPRRVFGRTLPWVLAAIALLAAGLGVWWWKSHEAAQAGSEADRTAASAPAGAG
ncbi:MAG TPA: hypothetical protein VE029_08185, partial [Rhizobacter sp.]|nr:hypothetical protein [Rhizobacter sp.]